MESSPNNAGVAIYGDYLDFENLYEALHKVARRDDETDTYFPASVRVLSLCHEIRHALMGNREYEFVDNGLNKEKKLNMALLAPNKNMYFKINILWPEMLFIMIALNDFLEIYSKEEVRTNYTYNLYGEPKVIWSSTVNSIRTLQVSVTDCLKGILTPNTFTRLINLLNNKSTNANNYLVQYIDKLNDRFLKMDKEKRLKNISIIGKRIAEKDDEYFHLEAQFYAEAERLNCNITDLRLALDYDEEIVW